MEPGVPPPVGQRPLTWPSRWQRLRGSWRWCALAILSLVYLSGLILHVRLNNVLGSLLHIAMYAFYCILLAPFVWGVIRANPHIWRLRAIRWILAGIAVATVVTICIAITSAVSGQSTGTAQVILGAIGFAAYCFIFVAMFVGLLDASKSVIARYQSEHSRSSDA